MDQHGDFRLVRMGAPVRLGRLRVSPVLGDVDIVGPLDALGAHGLPHLEENPGVEGIALPAGVDQEPCLSRPQPSPRFVRQLLGRGVADQVVGLGGDDDVRRGGAPLAR